MNSEAHVYDLKENAGVQYQRIDESLVEAFPKIYIFSLDPNHHVVSKGGLGEFIIPGKGEGEKVSKPLVIRGKHPSHMHLGGEISPVHYEDGMLLARDIVGSDSSDKGLGRHTSNLEWYGIFITHNEVPTKAEIEAAKDKRRTYLERLVADGDSKHMSGRPDNRPDAVERAAAHELNLKKTWAEKPSAMDSCPACGSAVLPGVAVCHACRAILDETAARKYFPERFATSEPPRDHPVTVPTKRV